MSCGLSMKRWKMRAPCRNLVESLVARAHSRTAPGMYEHLALYSALHTLAALMFTLSTYDCMMGCCYLLLFDLDVMDNSLSVPHLFASVRMKCFVSVGHVLCFLLCTQRLGGGTAVKRGLSAREIAAAAAERRLKSASLAAGSGQRLGGSGRPIPRTAEVCSCASFLSHHCPSSAVCCFPVIRTPLIIVSGFNAGVTGYASCCS